MPLNMEQVYSGRQDAKIKSNKIEITSEMSSFIDKHYIEAGILQNRCVNKIYIYRRCSILNKMNK